MTYCLHKYIKPPAHGIDYSCKCSLYLFMWRSAMDPWKSRSCHCLQSRFCPFPSLSFPFCLVYRCPKYCLIRFRIDLLAVEVRYSISTSFLYGGRYCSKSRTKVNVFFTGWSIEKGPKSDTIGVFLSLIPARLAKSNKSRYATHLLHNMQLALWTYERRGTLEKPTHVESLRTRLRCKEQSVNVGKRTLKSSILYLA